jgi:hypothetical protein
MQGMAAGDRAAAVQHPLIMATVRPPAATSFMGMSILDCGASGGPPGDGPFDPGVR